MSFEWLEEHTELTNIYLDWNQEKADEAKGILRFKKEYILREALEIDLHLSKKYDEQEPTEEIFLVVVWWQIRLGNIESIGVNLRKNKAAHDDE